MTGHPWIHKRVDRICGELELNLRIKARKRLKWDKPDMLAAPEAPNIVRSMAFMAGRPSVGRRFRPLMVPGYFNRDGLGIEVGVSLPPGTRSEALSGSSSGAAGPAP